MNRQLKTLLSILYVVVAIVSTSSLYGVRTRGQERRERSATPSQVATVSAAAIGQDSTASALSAIAAQAPHQAPAANLQQPQLLNEEDDEEDNEVGCFEGCKRWLISTKEEISRKAQQAGRSLAQVRQGASQRLQQAKQATSDFTSNACQRLRVGYASAVSQAAHARQRVGGVCSATLNYAKAAKNVVADKYKRFEKWRTTDTHFIPSRYIDYDHVYCFGREVENPIEIITTDGFVFIVPGWIADYSKMITDAINDDNNHVDLSQHAFATANTLYIVLFYCGELYRFDQLHAQEDFSDDQLEEMRATFLRQLDLLNKFHDVCKVLALVLHFDFEISLVEKILIEQAVAFLCRSTTIDTAPLHITAIEQPEVRQKIYTKFKETLRKKLGLAIQPAH